MQKALLYRKSVVYAALFRRKSVVLQQQIYWKSVVFGWQFRRKSVYLQKLIINHTIITKQENDKEIIVIP